MKRTLLASILGIAASLTTAPSSPGQGQIIFDNFASANYTQVSWFPWAAPGYSVGDIVNDANVIINLWAGQGTLSDSSMLSLIASTPINTDNMSGGGGWYQGGAINIPTTMWTGSQNITFQVRATGINYYAIAFGWSELWTEASSNIVTIGNPQNHFEHGPMPIWLIPEPSTLTLAGLGAAALLTFRKRG
jgi:hypothetical protein